MSRQPPERRGQRGIAQACGERLERAGGRCIQLFYLRFLKFDRGGSGLHPYPYSSKFPPLPGKFAQQIGHALTKQRPCCAAGCNEFKLLGPGIGDMDVGGQRRRQPLAQQKLQTELAPAPLPQIGQHRLRFEDLP